MKTLYHLKKSALFAGFCACWALLMPISCSKEPSLKIESITPITVDVQADRETTVGNLKENGYQITIPAGTFNSDVTISVTGSTSEAENAYKSKSKFERLGSPVNIHVEGTEGTVWLNEMATLSFPLPVGFAVKPDNIYHIFGSSYNPDTKTVEYIYPNMNELLLGRITFPLMHFSDKCPILLNDTEVCTKFAKERATAWLAAEKKKEDTSKMLSDSFKEVYEKMGITDKSMLDVLVKGAVDQTDIGSFYSAVSEFEAGSLATMISQEAGDKLLTWMKVNNMTQIQIMTTNPFLVQGVGNAISKSLIGDYKGAGLAISEAILEYGIPHYKVLKLGTELINQAVLDFYKSQVDKMYDNFTKPGVSIDDDYDWDKATEKQYASLLRKMSMDEIKANCTLLNVSSLSYAEEEAIRAKVKNNLRQTIRDRVGSETRIKQKQEEYLDIIRHFKTDGLFSFFNPGTDMGNRLARLFSWRERILWIAGGTLISSQYTTFTQEENLQYALKFYIMEVWENGCTKQIPGGELRFYEWLVREGFIKAEEAINLTEVFGSYQGDAEVYSYVRTNGVIMSEQTVTQTLRVIIGDAGSGKASIRLNSASIYDATGTIMVTGALATFSASFSNEVYGAPLNGSWSGSIRRADNKYVLTGKLTVGSYFESTTTGTEFTFTNLPKI